MSDWYTCKEKLPPVWKTVIVKRFGLESFKYRALFSLTWNGNYYDPVEPDDQWMYFND
jgi:hypothetical protein